MQVVANTRACAHFCRVDKDVVRFDEGKENLMASADGLVLEMNEWMHSVDPGITTGRGLMRMLRNAYYGPFLEDFEMRLDAEPRFLVFVADNYIHVPSRKSGVHASRAADKTAELRKMGLTQEEVDKMTFSDQSIPAGKQRDASTRRDL